MELTAKCPPSFTIYIWKSSELLRPVTFGIFAIVSEQHITSIFSSEDLCQKLAYMNE
jgi:hypothetical protein